MIALKRASSRLDRIADVASRLRLLDADGGCSEPVRAAAEEADLVVHAATNYGRAGEPASAILETNAVFPLRLLEAAARGAHGIFVNADTSLPASAGAYALAKAQFRAWGERFAGDGSVRFVNVRLEHMYGPGDDPSKFTTHVIRGCIDNVPELPLTPGAQRRDFIYIEDVVSAFERIVTEALKPGPARREYGVGSGVAVTLREFAETVRELSGSSTRLAFGARPYRPNEIMHSVADIRALQDLGWRCRYGLRGGLQETIQRERQQ